MLIKTHIAVFVCALVGIFSCGGEKNKRSDSSMDFNLSSNYAYTAPTDLSATVLGSTRVLLSWNDTSNEEEFFQIERVIGADTSFNYLGADKISRIGRNQESFKDIWLSPGTTYRYRVGTGKYGQLAVYSNIVTVTMPTGIDEANPIIEAVSPAAQIIDENVYVIKGRNFGSKSPAAPVRWLDFQNGEISDPIDPENTLSGWNSGELDVLCVHGVCPHYNPEMPRFQGDIGLKQTYRDYTDGNPANEDRVQNQTIGINSGANAGNYWGNPIPNPFYFRAWIYRENVFNAGQSTNQKLYGNFGTERDDDTYGCQSRVDTYGVHGGNHLYIDPVNSTDWPSVQYSFSSGIVVDHFDEWIRIDRFVDTGTPYGGDGSTWVAQNGYRFADIRETNVLAGEPYYNYFVFGQYFRTYDTGAAMNSYVSEVYIDDTLARVEVCIEDKFDGALNCEIQIPQDWYSEDGYDYIAFKVHQGAMVDGQTAHIFVVNEDGLVNQAGFDVRFEGGHSEDTTPPSAVSDLQVILCEGSSCTLQWMSPGDDGSEGTASQYDVRYSMEPISEGNWFEATRAVEEPLPVESGTIQSMTINVLSESGKYYFAIKTRDESYNWSDLSNVASTTLIVGENNDSDSSGDDSGYDGVGIHFQTGDDGFYGSIATGGCGITNGRSDLIWIPVLLSIFLLCATRRRFIMTKKH